MTGERLTYRFGPLERRGILGQIRAGQAVAVAAGALAAIVVLDRAPTAAGAFLGTLLVAASLLVAFAPVGRRTVDEWLPVVASFGVRRARGRLRLPLARSHRRACWRPSTHRRCGGCSDFPARMPQPP